MSSWSCQKQSNHILCSLKSFSRLYPKSTLYKPHSNLASRSSATFISTISTFTFRKWDLRTETLPPIISVQSKNGCISNRFVTFPKENAIFHWTIMGERVKKKSWIVQSFWETFPGFAIIPWNNPKKLEKPCITKGQYLAIFRVDSIM